MSDDVDVRHLLFLAHRIPYPPDKGDKIRSWNVLRHLARHARVSLAAFVDDPDDWRHRGVLDELCEEVHLVPLDPARAKLRSLRGLLTGEALSVPYYRDRRMAEWVRERTTVDAVYAFSSTVAPYVTGPGWETTRRVFDFVDVDSDKWRQYAERKRGPARLLYARESRRLLDFERETASEADLTLFVSEEEAALFRRLSGLDAERVRGLPNGVDVTYFDPAAALDEPPPEQSPTGTGPWWVFTGAMDYWANVDAVSWFVEQVLPLACERTPDAQFVIVGSKPTDEVVALGDRPGVYVTGRVPDVRPYLRRASVVVAPLRIARGIQNKVLEALAMAKPVVATPAAAEGIDARSGTHLLVADSPSDTVDALARAADPAGGAALGRAGRRLIEERYSWDATLAPLAGWLSESVRARAEAPQ